MSHSLAAFLVPVTLCAFTAAPLAQSPAPTLRVFLLAGQSNMEGHGVVDLDDARDYNGGRGILARFVDAPDNQKEWGHLRSKDGTWAVGRAR